MFLAHVQFAIQQRTLRSSEGISLMIAYELPSSLVTALRNCSDLDDLINDRLIFASSTMAACRSATKAETCFAECVNC
jgi:hypothetical protein